MADKNRTATHSVALEQELEREPYRFGFFQALRLLECLAPNKPRLGQSLRSADDPIRLTQEPSMDFAPSTLAAFRPGKDGEPSRLSVYFFGLFGPNGPLPLHLTEFARNRTRNDHDPTLSRFLDVFHHRMLSLFYRAWADTQPTVSLDRPETDRFGTRIGSLFGIGMESYRDRDALSDLAKLHYAGQLACQTHHAAGLQAFLGDYYDMPVRIEQFIGQWIELSENSRCRLGESPGTGTLGASATIGERVWDCQQKFRITFGPLGFEDYQRLLPGNDSLERLVAIVRNYVGDELTWDVSLILKKEEVPPLMLGGKRGLGWTTWLFDMAMERDASDLFLDPCAQ